MKKHPSPEEWAEEFKEFAAAPSASPPRQVSDRIFTKVHADLNPAIWLVGAKLALIHLVVGSVTLLFCPQFGINLGGGMGVMGLLMQYGEQACMLGCGAVFMAGSALTASLVLSSAEVRKIRSSELLFFPALALFSLGALVCVGGTIALSLTFFWLLGSVIGGLATLEFGWIIRTRNSRIVG